MKSYSETLSPKKKKKERDTDPAGFKWPYHPFASLPKVEQEGVFCACLWAILKTGRSTTGNPSNLTYAYGLVNILVLSLAAD